MSEAITLRGYAVPFGQTAHVGDGKLEQFAPSAFAEMLARPKIIDLRWDSHEDDAPRLVATAGGGLSLFADEYGLGFLATLSMTRISIGRLQAMMQRKDPKSFCSIGGLKIKASHQEKVLIGTAEVVTSATIDHVTICAKPSYRGTGVWLDHVPLDQAPLRIQELDNQWAEGWRASQRKQAAEARMVAQLRPIGRTVTGHLVMLAPNGHLHLKHGVSGRLIR